MRASVMIVSALSLGWVFALAPPTNQRVERCSSNGQFCAVSEPASRRTVVIRTGQPGQSLYSISGAFEYMNVSDDGQTLVVLPSAQLVDSAGKGRTEAMNSVVLVIYVQGQRKSMYRVRDLVKRAQSLQETEMPGVFVWAEGVAFEEKDRVRVDTIEKKIRRIQP